MTMDYGEGEPVLEEFRTQVEEEVVEEVAPVTRYYDMNTKEFSLSVKIGNFDVVIKDDKIVSITKDGKKPSTRSRRRVQNKILDQELINVEKGDIVDYQGSDEVELATLISDESTNAKEVANEIQTVQEKIKSRTKKNLQKKEIYRNPTH